MLFIYIEHGFKKDNKHCADIPSSVKNRNQKGAQRQID